MECVVAVGGWEHECCGQQIERGQLVHFECVPGNETGPDYVFSPHSSDGPAVECTGRVVDIQLTGRTESTCYVDRVPSGRAVRGFADDDPGTVEDLTTGEALSPPFGTFLVRLSSATVRRVRD